MPIALVMSASLEQPTSNGARLVTTDGRELPLTGARLHADAAGGVARTIVEQRFTNPYAEALAVTYSLPLPSDGAVSSFAFRLGDRRIQGEVQRRAEARAEYERALVEGRSAALLEQDRSSLFTQEIGNIPPGETLVAEITVDQPLRWLDEGAWEWRFPTVVAPRYLGATGVVPDAARVTQDVADGPIAARFTLACTVRDALADGRMPESPSHAMRVDVDRAAAGSYRTAAGSHEGGPPAVTMHIDEGARLDRDVVVRWTVARPGVGLSLQLGRPPAHLPHSDRAYGLLTLVPPSPRCGKAEAAAGNVARDLIVLLDTSGSMGGEPLDQARRVVGALVDTLGPEDQLEMIEFSSRARRWRGSPAAATPAAKKEALGWLRDLRAGGSTEMVQGILEAMRGLRPGAQRQVVVVTDGQIGFESQVIAAISDQLPPGSRLHTVGVGSAVNRSLTGPAARAGRGVEVILGLGEDPERAAARLVARTAEPRVVDLSIAGSALVEHAPRRLPDLYSGAPALVGLALRPEGGDLLVRGRTATGTWEQRVAVPPVEVATGSTAVVALFGREKVEDDELALAAGGDRRAIDAHIEKAGLAFQLATRLTSWIAVTQEVTVDPRGALRRERMPHELPHGVSAEGIGLRAAQMTAAVALAGPAAADGGSVSIDALDDVVSWSAPRAKVDLKARLAKTVVAGPSRAPSPIQAPQVSRDHRFDPAYEVRARRSNVFGATLLVIPIAFAAAFYFLRSFGLSFAIAVAAFMIALVIRAVLRRLFA